MSDTAKPTAIPPRQFAWLTRPGGHAVALHDDGTPYLITCCAKPAATARGKRCPACKRFVAFYAST